MKRHAPLFAFSAFIGTCLVLFVVFYEDAKKQAVDDLNSRQMLHARQAAQGIEQYFDGWLYTLEILAKNDHIIALDAEGRQLMESVYARHNDEIKAITRVDHSGRIIDAVPVSHDVMGKDISFQVHIQEMMSNHRPLISDIFAAPFRGINTIAVHVPVFSGGSYEGSIGILINFHEIARRYLEGIHIGKTGYAWMISRDGTELFCPVPGHVGKSVFENCKDFPSIIAMAHEMLQGRQGITTYAFDKIHGDTLTPMTKHAVYMPIKVGSTFWSIAVASSEEDIIASLVGFRNGLIFVMGLLLMGGIFFSYYSIKAWQIVQEEKIRTAAEQALRESEEFLKGITSALPGVVFQFYARENGEMGMYYVSDRSKEILGIDNDINGYFERAYACIAPEDRDRFAESIRDAVRTRSPWKMEGRFIRPDGTELCVRGISQPEEREGELVFNGLLLDITESWRVQEALRESEERYRLHFQSASDVIFTISSDMKILTMAPSVERILGVKPEMLIGKPLTDLKDMMTQDSWDKALQNISKLMAGETVLSAEYELFRQDGSRVFGEVSANPIISDGTVIAAAAIGRDVTERYMAEEAVKESRQQLSDIIDFLPDATLVIDTDGIIIAWNRAMEEMTGVEAKDMLGKGNYEYALPFYGERRPILIDLVLRHDDETEAKYVRVDRGERVLQGEAYMPVLRGGEAYLLGTASALRDSKGTIVGAIETIHDITERRHAEELYMTLAASAQVGVYIVQEGSFAFVNPHIPRYSGFSEAELVGKRSLAFVHPQDQAMVKEQAKERLRKQSASPYEYRIVDKSGTVKWLMETVSAIHYRGKPAVLGNTMDITERKSVEWALQESEEKYRLLVEHAGEAIFIAQDNVLKFANQRTVDLVGYTAEELANIPFINHIHPDDRDLVASNHLKRLSGQTVPPAYTFRVVNRDGDLFWVDLNAVLVQWEGRPATLNFMRDITFQKNIEFQLMRSQKMEAVGTLAGGIAHDFNNLLMGIQGYASLMLLDTASNHPHREKLKSIEQIVQSGADLTRQLLGFARGGRYEMTPTNLNEMIEKTSRMFGRTKKEITIFTKYEKELRPVEVDPGQIEQVLVNLYVNAWQAMPVGGTLFLETLNAVLDEHDAMAYDITPGQFVKISVMDSGVGMDQKTMERIFEPFFTTKEMGRGTGLGLATVYGIVKGHKGIITVSSEKGEGTTFDIYLPASTKNIPAKKEDNEEVLHGKETILIVDDEEAIVCITKEMLENLGYRTLTARSGPEAVEIYKTHGNEIDLVILDMIMPDMSGGEVFDHLKGINPGAKAILSSGYSIDGQAQAILDRGCLAFLQKPFTMKVLSRKVRQVLDL